MCCLQYYNANIYGNDISFSYDMHVYIVLPSLALDPVVLLMVFQYAVFRFGRKNEISKEYLGTGF